MTVGEGVEDEGSKLYKNQKVFKNNGSMTERDKQKHSENKRGSSP